MQILSRKGWLIILICVVIWIALSWAHDEFFWDLKAPVIDESFFLLQNSAKRTLISESPRLSERSLDFFYRIIICDACGFLNVVEQIFIVLMSYNSCLSNDSGRSNIQPTSNSPSVCKQSIETSSGKMKGRRLIKRFFLPFHWAVNMNEFKTIDVF